MSVFLPAEAGLVLETGLIQGNVLGGFKADHQRMVFLGIEELEAARAWLRALGPQLTSVEDVVKHRQRSAEEEVGPEPKEPWVNVALGFGALRALGYPADFTDTPLRVGIESRSARLGDRPGSTEAWKVGGVNPIDLLLIIAAASDEEVAARAETLLGENSGLLVRHVDVGATLPNRGHEHFGFRDGVSQPGVFGAYKHDPNQPLTERQWTSPPKGDGTIEAKAGTPLIWPGEFVFGYPCQGSAPRDPDPPRHAGDRGNESTDNGSLLVFRRLHQDVAAFRRFCRAKAAELDCSGAWTGMSAELLAALIVGRWPSGQPVDSTVAKDPGAEGDPPNDFEFDDDPSGARCPLDAHVRKVNPREGDADVTPLVRRVIRRGIPYGPPLPEGTEKDDGAERGLIFICYQTSIQEQFEALTHDWMNSEGRPAGNGHDVLVGQKAPTRRLALYHPTEHRQVEFDVDVEWITPTGGAYLFAPPIDALRRI